MEKLANPAALGLTGFGMTTVLLNIHNFFKGLEGLEAIASNPFPLASIILAMGICYGGVAQIIAGIMEYRNQNIFGTTAFISYGLFWWSLVVLVLLPKVTFLTVGKAAEGFLGWYLFLWGVFTFWMFIGALKEFRALQSLCKSLCKSRK